jgi:farnesyl diphosphate synthase
MTGFSDEADRAATLIEKALDAALTADALAGPGCPPERLVGAMRHGALAGGKRLRPLLVMQSAAIFSVPVELTIPTATAVEMIHCYSLIHDDLPAMDDDEMRRGQPTVHRKYDEATAILAGDSLLTRAFGLLADPSCHKNAEVRTKLVAELAAGSGAGGMAGGQMADLEGEGTRPHENEIASMQAMKTGALIRASVRMGALLGGSDNAQLAALTDYGEAAGRAFQLADDILDITASAEQMGKATGKDARRGKPTLVARIGVEAAKRHLGDHIHHAISALTMFGPEADPLRATARYFGDRER